MLLYVGPNAGPKNDLLVLDRQQVQTLLLLLQHVALTVQLPRWLNQEATGEVEHKAL